MASHARAPDANRAEHCRRRTRWIAGFLLLAGAASPCAAATAGAEIAHGCNHCHGTDGRSEDPEVPSIAGFSEFAIMDLIQTYRDGLREGVRMPLEDGTETDMVEISQALTDEELESVAVHYAGLAWQPHPQDFDRMRARRGAAVHRVKCAKCHIEGGSIAEADLALLAGQWRDYLAAQFTAFDDGARRMAPKMKSKYDSLSATDKEALLEFYVSAGPLAEP